MNSFLLFLRNLVPVLLGFGTFMGKDPLFKLRGKKQSGPWVVAALGAADRMQFADLTDLIMKIENTENRAKQYIAMRMQVIAASIRNKHGYYLFDPLNENHLLALSNYPELVLSNAIDVIDELSGLPWIVMPKESDDKPENEPLDDSSKLPTDEDEHRSTEPALVNP